MAQINSWPFTGYGVYNGSDTIEYITSCPALLDYDPMWEGPPQFLNDTLEWDISSKQGVWMKNSKYPSKGWTLRKDAWDEEYDLRIKKEDGTVITDKIVQHYTGLVFSNKDQNREYKYRCSDSVADTFISRFNEGIGYPSQKNGPWRDRSYLPLFVFGGKKIKIKSGLRKLNGDYDEQTVLQLTIQQWAMMDICDQLRIPYVGPDSVFENSSGLDIGMYLARCVTQGTLESEYMKRMGYTWDSSLLDECQITSALFDAPVNQAAMLSRQRIEAILNQRHLTMVYDMKAIGERTLKYDIDTPGEKVNKLIEEMNKAYKKVFSSLLIVGGVAGAIYIAPYVKSFMTHRSLSKDRSLSLPAPVAEG